LPLAVLLSLAPASNARCQGDAVQQKPRGELLLVGTAMGIPARAQIPGGGIKRRESPAGSRAVREIREEVGVEVDDMLFLSEHVSQAEGRRDTVHLLRGSIDKQPKPDRIEVIETRLLRSKRPAGWSVRSDSSPDRGTSG
jgi:8-oxo-dGTP pyrophosphatase MutT (NUDIX family)